MNRKEAVQLIDPTAQLQTWDGPGHKGFWVKGNGWETKVTYSETRAWDIALMEVTSEVAR